MHGGQCRGVRIIQTFRMAESAGAVTNPAGPARRLSGAAGAVRVRNDVEDDVVRAGRVAANALHSTEGVEQESIPDLPGHHMVGAGGVSADAEPANSASVFIKHKSTAKHVHAADAVADHRISLRAEILGAALAWLETGLADSGLAVSVAICDASVNGVAVLQAVETAARLHRGEQVGSRQGEPVCPEQATGRRAAFAEAEAIGRVRLLGRNDTTVQPLVDELAARKGNSTHGAVIGHQCAPHIESQTTVTAGSDDIGERCFEGLPTGQCRAVCKCRAGKDRKECAGRNRKYPLLDAHRTSPFKRWDKGIEQTREPPS